MSWSFEDFVASRGGSLWRLAWLLGGSDSVADELLDVALVRTWPRRDELERGGDAFEAGVRRELVSAWLPRRHGDVVPALPHEQLPARGGDDVLGAPGDVDLEQRRRRTLALLRALAPRQRAAVALGGLPELAFWDAADALDCSSAQLRGLQESAVARVRELAPDADRLLAGLDAIVPVPPYAGDRAGRLRRRTGADERRRRLRALTASAVVATVVAVPVLWTSTSDPTERSVSSEPGTSTSAAAERLVDPLPIPETCQLLPDQPGRPAYPYEVDGADALWLRFCPARDRGGDLDALAFAPDTTVVAQEVDEVVDAWVMSEQGPNPCNYSAYAHQGLVRMQVGTLDGAVHVLDMRVGTCGRVSVDGADLAVDGRTAFADAVTLLGTELLDEVDEPGAEPPPAAAFCPDAPEQVVDLERTTVPDLPRVQGLPLPLPARSALVCGYSPVPGADGEVTIRDAGLDAERAETLRAAYLARGPEVTTSDGRVIDDEPDGYALPGGPGAPPVPGCREDRVATVYAVLVTDVTGSRRSFTVDLGRCAAVSGPGSASGSAGPWLSEVLAFALG